MPQTAAPAIECPCERKIEALRRELDDVRARLDRVEGTGGGAVDAYEAAVLTAIAAAVGERRFTSSEIREYARHDPDRTLAEALQAVDIETPRALGKLLARLERTTIAGLQLTRVDVDRDGIVWSVRVSPPPNSQD